MGQLLILAVSLLLASSCACKRRRAHFWLPSANYGSAQRVRMSCDFQSVCNFCSFANWLADVVAAAGEMHKCIRQINLKFIAPLPVSTFYFNKSHIQREDGQQTSPPKLREIYWNAGDEPQIFSLKMQQESARTWEKWGENCQVCRWKARPTCMGAQRLATIFVARVVFFELSRFDFLSATLHGSFYGFGSILSTHWTRLGVSRLVLWISHLDLSTLRFCYWFLWWRFFMSCFASLYSFVRLDFIQ